MYHIVEFHADGGQMCVPGRRSFPNPEEASKFAERMRSEPEHTCGPESVRTYTSETDPGNEGHEYPMIANSGREMFRIQEEDRFRRHAESRVPSIVKLFHRLFSAKKGGRYD